MKLKKISDVKMHTMTTLYGEPGTGKTSKIGGMPGKVLVIDTDRGLASVESNENISVAECYSFSDCLEALEFAKVFDSIVVDHLTNVQEFCYSDLLQETGKEKMSLNLYGDASKLMKRFVQHLVDYAYLGKNVLVLCQQKSINVEDVTNENVPQQIVPNLMDSVKSFLTASSRIVAHTEKVSKSRIVKGDKITKEFYQVRFSGNPVYTLKVTRKPDLAVPDVLTSPSYMDIVGLVDGKTQSKLQAKKEKGDK